MPNSWDCSAVTAPIFKSIFREHLRQAEMPDLSGSKAPKPVSPKQFLTIGMLRFGPRRYPGYRTRKFWE